MEKDQGVMRVFLSYKRKDFKLANAIRQEIRGLSNRCEFFVDVEVINAFQDWEKKIEEELKRSQYFLLIYTGKENDYEYCMTEAGRFAAYHTIDDPNNGEPSQPAICCLYDTDDFPAFFKRFQNYRVSGPPLANQAEAADGSRLSRAEEDFYENCDLAKFFKSLLCSLPTPQTALRPDFDNSEFRTKRIDVVRLVTKAFLDSQQGRILFEKPLQDRIMITVPPRADLRSQATLDRLLVDASDQTLGLFNIIKSDVPTTWGTIKDAYKRDGQYVIPWITDIEKAIEEIIGGRTPKISLDITFRALDSPRVFRPIPARYIKYIDGRYDIFVSVVPTRPKSFVGDSPGNSMLLMGLFFAARFRAEVLERKHSLFLDTTVDQKVDEECSNLKRRIEIIENEASEVGLTNPTQLLQAVGEEYHGTINHFFSEWLDVRASLMTVIDERLRADRNSPSDDYIKSTIQDGLNRVKPLNREFVLLMCERIAAVANVGEM